MGSLRLELDLPATRVLPMIEQQPNPPLTATGLCFLLVRPSLDGHLTWKALEKLAGPLPRAPLLVDLTTGDLYLAFRLPDGVTAPMRRLGSGLWLISADMAPHDLSAWLDPGEPLLLPISWRIDFSALGLDA